MSQFFAALRVTARRLWHSDDSGVALVEFALILPILVVLLFGMLDFGKAFNYWLDGNHLASEGARLAAVGNNPGAAASKTLANYIRDEADSNELKNGSGSVSTPMQVCITFPDGQAVGNRVKVTIHAGYSWLSALNLGIGPSNIDTSATMRVERLAVTSGGSPIDLSGCST